VKTRRKLNKHKRKVKMFGDALSAWQVGWPKLHFSRNTYYKFWRSEIERSVSETNLKEMLFL